MSRTFAAIALLAMVALGRGAAADEAIGWITLLDHENDKIVLDNGQTFGVSEEINFSALNDRVRVKIVYYKIDGQNIVTDIFPASDAPAKAKAKPAKGTSSLPHKNLAASVVKVAAG